jgi:peptidoglycan/xylan/chitin deacetylase (PgdA/CDA1 family)
LKAAILTYHSQNVAGNDTSNNDHKALAADLQALHDADCRFVSMQSLLNSLFGDAVPDSGQDTDRPLVCLTFDDGCDFEVRTLEFAGFGVQPGFLSIMEDFIRQHGEDAQPGLHATSFVIASPAARRIIDQGSLFGQGHMSDDWWRAAADHPLLAVGNHGWDHNHPDLVEGLYPRGGFTVIETLEHCRQQVVQAGDFIRKITGQWPEIFAYPFGESSDYIRDEFFPNHSIEHQSLAALGTSAGLVSAQSNRWDLPRFVCGRDWSTPDELLSALRL